MWYNSVPWRIDGSHNAITELDVSKKKLHWFVICCCRMRFSFIVNLFAVYLFNQIVENVEANRDRLKQTITFIHERFNDEPLFVLGNPWFFKKQNPWIYLNKTEFHFRFSHGPCYIFDIYWHINIYFKIISYSFIFCRFIIWF